jgi:hypothetical protein
MTAAPVDIVVYGGTPGGLIAAVAAARLGAPLRPGLAKKGYCLAAGQAGATGSP